MHRGAQQNGRAAHLRRLCRAAWAPPHRSPRRSWPRSGARSNAPAAWDGSRSKHRLQEPQKGAGHAARHLHEAEGPAGPAASRCAAPAAPPVARKRLPARPAIKSSDKVPGIIPPPAKSRCSIVPAPWAFSRTGADGHHHASGVGEGEGRRGLFLAPPVVPKMSERAGVGAGSKGLGKRGRAHDDTVAPRAKTVIDDSARAEPAKVARVSFPGASVASPDAADSPAAEEGEKWSGRVAEVLSSGGAEKPAGDAEDAAVFVPLEDMVGGSSDSLSAESDAVRPFSPCLVSVFHVSSFRPSV